MIRVGAVKFGLTGRRSKKGGGRVSPNPGGGGLGMGPKDDKEKNKPGRPGGGGGSGGDEFTMLLSHFDTAIEDDSGRHVLTPYGSPSISATAKFGSGSLYLPGNSYLLAPDSEDWAFGSGDFTAEGFFNFEAKGSHNTHHYLMGQDNGGKTDMSWRFWRESGVLKFEMSQGTTTSIIVSSPFNPTYGQWYHLAVDRVGTTVRLYVDGVMVASLTTALSIHLSNWPLSIGRFAPSNTTYAVWDFRGHIDALRISKGIARYGSDSGFAVPASPF